ncbi:MAG: hypothetical protein JWP89_6841 [Schlesneria sp.]|nr:hypothetical protein [Schlesneria sp.]
MPALPRCLAKSLLLVCTALSLASLNVVAQDVAPQDSDLVRRWLSVSLKHAQDYDIRPKDKPDERFTMLPQAVFRHSQPVRGDDIGAVYLWVDSNARPAAIGTTFAYTIEADRRRIVHEFHSLADGPLTADWRGKTQWLTKGAGLEWKPLPKAPVADANLATRTRQIRDIARRFSANSIDEKDGRWELRLVTKPIHQFVIEKPDSVWCGSLFLFCQGTDPELILAIEAKKQDNGYFWHYGAASFTDYGLSLRLDDLEVWTAGPRSTGADRLHWAGGVAIEALPDK